MIIFIIFDIYGYFISFLIFYCNIIIIIIISINGNNILTTGSYGSVFNAIISGNAINIIISLYTITIYFILF